MSDAIARGNIQLGVDGSGVKAGIADVKREIGTLSSFAEKVGSDASAGMERMGDGAAKAADKAVAAAKRIETAALREAAALETGKKAGLEFEMALARRSGIDVSKYKPLIAEVEQLRASQQRALAATAAVDPAVQKLGMSAKQTAFAMRGLPAQMTDIVVSLQSGQRPMTVLLQQGGQLKDMFGGIGNAARAIGSYVISIAPMMLHPFTLIAAAVAAASVAFYQGAEESARLNKALISTGNYTGKTANQLSEMAGEVGKVTNEYGTAREAVEALAATGQITGDQMNTALRGVVDGVKVTGKSVKDLTEDFVEITKDPIKGVTELNQKYNFLTAEVYSHIKALQEQGDKQAAATEAFRVFADAMAGRTPQIQENLGFIESGWDRVKKAIKAAVDVSLEFGRSTDLDKEIKRAEAALQSMEAARNPYLDEYIANERAYIAQLKEKQAATARATAAQGASNLAHKESVEGLKELEKFQDKYKSKATEIAKLEEAWTRAKKGLVAGSKEYNEALGNYNRGLDQINKKYQDKAGIRSINQEQHAYESLISTIQSRIAANELEYSTDLKATEAQKMRIKFDQELASGKLKLNAAHQSEIRAELDKLDVKEKANRQNKFRVDFNTQHERSVRDMVNAYETEIKSMGMTAEEAEKLASSSRILFSVEEQIREGRRRGLIGSDDQANAMRQQAQQAADTANQYISAKYAKDRDPYAGLTASMTRYGEEAQNVGKQIGDTFSNAMSSAEDAWVQFAQTGKLSFSSLAQSVIADMARIQFRQMMGGSGVNGIGLLGLFSSIFGGSGGYADEMGRLNAQASAELSGFAPRALGGPVTAGTSYLVGEKRPEIFTPSVSGYISPSANGAGVTVHSTNVFNIDSRADRAAVRSDMEKIAARSNAQLVDKLQRQGVIAA